MKYWIIERKGQKLALQWQTVQLWAVLLARISSFIFVMPVFGNKMVPLPAKIGLCGFLSLFLLSRVQSTGAVLPDETIPFVLMIAREVLIGLALGTITKFLFAGVEVAGEAIGLQMGFGMADVMDPGFETQVSVVGEFQVAIVFLIYLSIDGHHFLIQGLAQSYQGIPVGTGPVSREVGSQVVNLASGMFVAGVKIGAPVLVALFLTTVALGILARTVPEMNVFVVGLPLKIGIGFLVMALSIGIFAHLFQNLWTAFQKDFLSFFRYF